MNLYYAAHVQTPANSREFGHSILPPETAPGKNAVFGPRGKVPQLVSKTLAHAAILL